MQCPQCATTLHRSATFCGCGWQKKTQPLPSEREKHVNCAHDGCFLSAKVKIQTKTGWANLCMRHYEEHFAAEAERSLSKWGMERLADESKGEHVKRMRKFAKNGFKGFSSKSMAHATRRESRE